MAVRPIPEGNHSLTPRLVVKDAVSALEFYAKAFGATDLARHAGPDGKTHFAQFRIGEALVMLAEEGEGAGWRNISPQSLGGSPVMIHVYAADVDALARDAVAVGAKLVRPIKDEDRGDRVCTLIDPFGHRWMIATRKRDVSLDAQRKLDPQWKITEADKSNDSRSVPDDRLAVAYLAVNDGPRAIEFYKRAFGASETLRFADQSGRVGHATLRIGDSPLFLSDEFPGICSSPKTLGGSSVNIFFYTEDVDAIERQAVAAGARVLIPVGDRPWGDRQGRLEDPFGHIWTISTHKEDVSLEELRKRESAAH